MWLRRAQVVGCVAVLYASACARSDEAPPGPAPAPTGDPIVEPGPPPKPSPPEAPKPGPPGGAPEVPAPRPRPSPPTSPELPRRPGASEVPLAAVAELPGQRLEGETIAEVVKTHMERFRLCAREDAHVDLRLTLSGGGTVVQLEAPRSEPDDARLRDCVTDAMKDLRFERSPGSSTSTLEFRLVLRSPRP